MTKSRTERGQGLLEIALWLAAGVAAVGAGIFIVQWAQARGDNPLTPEQAAYVQSIATQQAASYIVAVATQQAEAANAAPPPSAPPAQANAPIRAATAAPSAPPTAPSAPPPAAPPPQYNTPPPPPTSAPAAQDSQQLADCRAAASHNASVIDELVVIVNAPSSGPLGLQALDQLQAIILEHAPNFLDMCGAVLPGNGYGSDVDAVCATRMLANTGVLGLIITANYGDPQAISEATGGRGVDLRYRPCVGELPQVFLLPR